MAVVYSVRHKEYSIELCTEEDINDHYEVIREDVQDVDEKVYKNAMEKSVNNNTAWKAVLDGEAVAWLYIHKVINTWFGASIYSKDLVGITLVFKEQQEATDDIVIRYSPHKGMLPLIKSLATRKSIRLYHNGRNYIRINTKHIKGKFKMLYEKLGASNVSCS